ncbi:MAG: TolC family protein, partial [Myxococcota bacterium]
MWWIAVAQAATLSDAWEAASGNPDRAAAAAMADAAAARVWAARAAVAPKLQLGVSGTQTDEAVSLDLGAALPAPLVAQLGAVPPIEVQPEAWWSTSATLVVPVVDLEGWATARAAARAREVARARVDVVELALRDGAAQAFAGLYVAREGARIAGEAVSLARSHREVAERRVAAGAGLE